MTDDVLIDVCGISKKFSRTLRQSISYGIKDIARNIIHLPANSSLLRDGEFWAVQDVNVKLKRGETLGIIGANGSGKSTILKMLNGIFMPDRGKIHIRGRVGALIEVGAGFHPMLTGRENIYVNGAILGMGKREIDQKFDAIVDFAELGDSIDMPVKFYSSGMFVRLGFAIAVHCQPDILLVDEVLAVGDLPFRVKCHNKLSEISNECSVVIVSHNMSAIARVASHCIVLNKGKTSFYGPVDQAVQHYYSICDQAHNDEETVAGTNEASLKKIDLFDRNNISKDTFRYGDEMTMALELTVDPKYDTFIVSLLFQDQGQIIAQCDSEYNDILLKNKGESTEVKIKLPKILFNPGTYSINLTIHDQNTRKYLYWNHKAKTFNVTGEFTGGAALQLSGEWEGQC